MSKMVHFEIPADDTTGAIKFYSTVFGWKFTEFMPGEYWSVEAGPAEEMGINGGLMKCRDLGQPIGNYINCENLEATMEMISKNGGQIVVPKSPVPTMGWFAFFKDPDGNIVGIWQIDSNAK